MTATHRMTGTPTHTSWRKMRERCRNPNSAQWPWYGGRGIRVSARWESFENFLADMGRRPPGTSLDRIDTNKDYEPGNCRWATHRQQVHGQRKTLRAGGRVLVAEAAAAGIAPGTVTQRFKRGVPKRDLLASRDLRNPITASELAEFTKLRANGRKQREIAELMCVRQRRVERMARMVKNGLSGWANCQLRNQERRR